MATPCKKVDIAGCREILERLKELGLPPRIEGRTKRWIDKKEKEQTGMGDESGSPA